MCPACVWRWDLNSSLALEAELQYVTLTTCCLSTSTNVQSKNRKYFLHLTTFSFCPLFFFFTNFLKELASQDSVSTSSIFNCSQALKPTKHPQALNLDFSTDFAVELDVSDHRVFSSLLPWVYHDFLPMSSWPFLLCQSFSLRLALLLMVLLMVLAPQASICAQLLTLHSLPGGFSCSPCCLFTTLCYYLSSVYCWLWLCSEFQLHSWSCWLETWLPC